MPDGRYRDEKNWADESSLREREKKLLKISL
jgi:hypothetical protein